MIKYKRNKFSRFDKDILKKYIQGWSGQFHHFMGKPYEYLATVRPMATEEHNNGFNHKKYIFGLPEEVRTENLAFWQSIMTDADYAFFRVEGHEG